MNSENLQREIYRLLKDPNLYLDLNEIIKEMRTKFEHRALLNGPYPEGWNIYECINDWLSDECHPRGTVGQKLKKKVLHKLNQPLPFTPIEIHDALGDQLNDLPPIEKWPPLDYGLRALIEGIEERKTQPIPLLTSEAIQEENWNELRHRGPLWEFSNCKVEIDSIATASNINLSGAYHQNRVTVYVSGIALMTEQASAEFEITLSKLLPLLVHLFANKYSTEYTSSKYMAPNELFEFLPSIQSALDVFFPNISKKNSTQTKLRNALMLLLEASNQNNDSISAAMSFAAIDAILGEKGQEVGQRILSLCARILEPKADFRAQAKQKIKSIYEIRNKVFHAGEMEYYDTDRSEAFLLAGSLFTALLEGLETRKRIEEQKNISLDELLKEVQKSEYDSGLIDGLIETNAVRLWRKDHNDI